MQTSNSKFLTPNSEFRILNPELFRLSQGQLNILETCPRKFQHIYFEQLNSPLSPEQQEHQNWGSNFHLLMQQRELGLPIELMIEDDPKLQLWLKTLINTAPEIFINNLQGFRESEHSRTLTFQTYLLTVIYDLLITDVEQAQILDWKTYPQPQKSAVLAKDWQTRLYLYVLAETSDYLPEQISMTYWFVQSQPETKSLKFTYNNQQHEKTRKDLTKLLNNLTIWLQQYQHEGKLFPQVSETSHHCQYCNFAVRCQRSPESRQAQINENWNVNLVNIPEVSL